MLFFYKVINYGDYKRKNQKYFRRGKFIKLK